MKPLTTSNRSEWLMLARTKLGLKQGELARQLGVSQSHLSNMEKGHTVLPSGLEKIVESMLKEKGVY